MRKGVRKFKCWLCVCFLYTLLACDANVGCLVVWYTLFLCFVDAFCRSHEEGKWLAGCEVKHECDIVWQECYLSTLCVSLVGGVIS